MKLAEALLLAGKTESYAVEAVATRIAWDCPDADVGDNRVLSVTLVGASKPGDWLVSGEIQVQNGKLDRRRKRVEHSSP